MGIQNCEIFKVLQSASSFLKLSLSEKATTICANFLMVLMFTE